MHIKLKIYKWTVFEFAFMCPDEREDLNFWWFCIDIFGVGLWFWRWVGISKLVVSFYVGQFFMREKYLIDDKE